MQDLYVSQGERGSGLGRRLLRETARRGKQRHASHLRLSVDHQNISASQFYERVGMHHRDEENTFHIGGSEFLDLVAG